MPKNRILDELGFEPAGGRISFHGVRYLVIRPETLVSIQRAMEIELGASAGRILFDAGRTGGTLSAARFRASFPDRSPEELVRFMCGLGTDIGWGRFNLLEFHPGDSFLVEVTNGPIASAYGPAKDPVCHLLRGVMAGLGEVVFGEETVATEAHCSASGPGPCEFAIRRSSAPVPFRVRPRGAELGG
jgi:predicted hydrocarbon binding protein